MKLIDQKTVRGANKEFTFEHKSKKLGTKIYVASAINHDNAQKKVWKQVSGEYKSLKQNRATA